MSPRKDSADGFYYLGTMDGGVIRYGHPQTDLDSMDIETCLRLCPGLIRPQDSSPQKLPRKVGRLPYLVPKHRATLNSDSEMPNGEVGPMSEVDKLLKREPKMDKFGEQVSRFTREEVRIAVEKDRLRESKKKIK